MNDVARLVLEAWEKLGAGIMGDSDELQRRLARRRRAVLMRPARAWCLCVRASDRRITAAHWVISPEHALDLDHPGHPYEPIEHEVTIRPHALRKFCRAVRTDSWGEQVDHVAGQLGVSRTSIFEARVAGLFTERFVKGLGGKRGHPIPLIHSWTTLDPSGVKFARPDPLWGAMWEYLADMVPDDFEQTLIRRPVFGRKRGTRGCPAGEIDKDDLHLWGWRWVCPGCGKEVMKIYYPLPPETVFDFLGFDPGRGRKIGRRSCAAPKKFVRCDVNEVEAPPPTFACRECHGVRGTERTSDNGWNQIVSHLTRGMLYGHEVEKPQWYRITRKRPRTRQLHRASPKRDAIFEMLKFGRTVDEIAGEMLISRLCVKKAMQQICRQEGVKDRHALAKKLGWAEQPLNELERRVARARAAEERLKPLLLEGLLYEEIAAKWGMRERGVVDAAKRIYARDGVGGREARRRWAEKLGVELGGRYGVEREIRERLLAGQTFTEIAELMGMSRKDALYRCWRIYRKEGVKGRKGLMEKYERGTKVEVGMGVTEPERELAGR